MFWRLRDGIRTGRLLRLAAEKSSRQKSRRHQFRTVRACVRELLCSVWREAVLRHVATKSLPPVFTSKRKHKSEDHGYLEKLA
jgi:hypothetical protein